MIRALLTGLAALGVTLGSLTVVTTNGERTMYGHEGGAAENFRPREQAGWPAPYFVDSPDTSVLHQIGVEDDLRPGNLIATFAFWLLVMLVLGRFFRRRN